MLLFCGTLAAASGIRTAPVSSAVPPQNIVLILTDDQRWDSLQYMPNVESLLVDHGVTFANAFDSNPLCCPTRSTIMTGLTSGHNGVWWNQNSAIGGLQAFLRAGDQKSQVFKWLHDAGYRTGLVGKFLNGYDNAGWIMPGVDDWQVFLIDGTAPLPVGCSRNGYWGTCYSRNGVVEVQPPSAYSTRTSGDKAVNFIMGADPGTPLFLYYAPRAPHLPTLPVPKFADACSDVPPIRGSSYNQPIVDGPAYMAAQPSWTPDEMRTWDDHWLDDCRTLLSVDKQVASIVQALQDTGRLANTMLVFASDNGYAFGEHRWSWKTVPYEPSIRVPVVIRDDAVIPAQLQGTTVEDPITSLDYTPTFLQAAGLSRALDGQSLYPLLTGTGTWTDQDSILIEHGGRSTSPRSDVPAYCGVRDPGYMYAQYSTGEEELYDLAGDPEELVNVAADPNYASVLTQLRGEAHALCDPTPPQFTWAH